MFDPGIALLLSAVPIGLAYETLMRRRDEKLERQAACHHSFRRITVYGTKHDICDRCGKQEMVRDE